MTASDAPTPAVRPRSGAASVAVGIFLSRIFGFLRDRAIAFYFGVGPHADVFRTALRGPNVLQNLLGEGTISASFIPVYTRMLGEGRREDAGRFAGAIFGLLLAAAALLALVGVLFARPLVALLVPGFLADARTGAAIDRFPLAVAAVRIIFPMTGLLVLSAWALGVLNSHRRFLLPYLAPVLWNAAIIAALGWVGQAALAPGGRDRLLMAACTGALAGGFLQFAVQLPLVARELRGFRISLSPRVGGVREALRAFGPVVAGRGVVQVTAYLDYFLASFCALGAVSAFGYAQTLYVLPVSLFAMSIAAAELPELSARSREPADVLRPRLDRGLRQMAFLNVPSCVGYLVFGRLLVAGLYQTGSFGAADAWLTYLVLCGLTLGLVATTFSRLLQNLFYAVGDAATPSRIAVWRVVVAIGLGLPAMLVLDRVSVARASGLPDLAAGSLFLGAAGLGLGAGLAAWAEFWLLDHAAGRRLPGFAPPWRAVGRMLCAAAIAVLPAALLARLLPPLAPALAAAFVLSLFAFAYLAAAYLLGVEEARGWLQRLGWRR